MTHPVCALTHTNPILELAELQNSRHVPLTCHYADFHATHHCDRQTDRQLFIAADHQQTNTAAVSLSQPRFCHYITADQMLNSHRSTQKIMTYVNIYTD